MMEHAHFFKPTKTRNSTTNIIERFSFGKQFKLNIPLEKGLFLHLQLVRMSVVVAEEGNRRVGE